jgi:hypothetical protein
MLREDREIPVFHSQRDKKSAYLLVQLKAGRRIIDSPRGVDQNRLTLGCGGREKIKGVGAKSNDQSEENDHPLYLNAGFPSLFPERHA